MRLIGGVAITGLKPVVDPKILARIDKAAHGKVQQIDLKQLDITDYGKLTPRGFGRPIQPAGLELFFNDQPMTLARWPNGDWTQIAAVLAGKDSGRFTYSGDRPSRWLAAEDVWIHGYWTYDWADTYEKVKNIDTTKKEIATFPPHGVYGYTPGKRYYALNLLEELDEPGEWYLNRKTGILYFWPPSLAGKTYVSTLEEPLISLQDASYVSLQDLTFEYTRGPGIEMTGGTGNRIYNCEVRNIGTIGINVQHGTKHRIERCRISETGDGAIVLNGGERKSLTPGDNYVHDCHLYRFSRWSRTYRPGVLISGVGNRIAHCLIEDAPHSAIILGGNEHLIEYNEIRQVCMETGDAGAFYMGRDYTQRGNMVRYNYFHHLRGVENQSGFTDVMAIYFDDCTSGNVAYGNVCYKAGRAVLLGGGRDTIIENNVFVDCTPAVHVDARGKGWASFWFDGRDSTLIKGLHAMNYLQPPFSIRYPELVTLMNDDPAMPKGNQIVRNIFHGGDWLQLHDNLNDKVIQIQDNWSEGDPGFISVEKNNFQLRDDSPAYKLGFKRIPIEKIGRIKN